MKTFFDCIPCLVRQALDSVRMVTTDEKVHEQVLRTILRNVSEIDLHQSPPAMAQRIHRLIRKLTGQRDPYRKIKDLFNRVALEIYPELSTHVENSANPVETALRLAIAGNVIDMGINSQLEESHLHEAIEHALTSPFDADMEGFSIAIAKAKNILYLTDNAGEIVFDKLLLNRLPLQRVTVAVKGSPVINDATIDDAQTAGLTEMVEVIDNGSDAPGTILSDCSKAFQQCFTEADLIIAKGQGNYETLSETNKNIFFVLKAKCPVIARDLGCSIGSLILRRSSHEEHTLGSLI
jgi:hypothetical protein